MAIPYQPPGVLTVTQLQSSQITPQLATGVEVPSLIGSAYAYPTQLDTQTAVGYGSVLTLSKKGVVYQGPATAIPQAALTIYNPTLYATIGYGNYNVTVTPSVDAYGNTVNITTVGFINYANAASMTPTITGAASGGAAFTPGQQVRYAVSYLVNDNSLGGSSVYETGIGLAYATVTLNSASAVVSQVALANVPGIGATGAGNGFTLVGRNVYRSLNLGSSASPYWSPWYQVFNTNNPVSIPGYSGQVSISGTASGQTLTDQTPQSSITSNAGPQTSINPGDTLQISYQYADSTYYQPTLFTRYSDVEAKYGPAFDSNGNVLSPLSFGAKLAVLNGASNIVCTAVASNDVLWGNAFANLVNDQTSTIIVPLTGNQSIQAAAAAHCTQMQQYNVFRTAIFGADGVGGTVTVSQLQQNASSYNRKDIQYVSPSIFRYFNPVLNVENQVGAQYAAAALAGAHAAGGPADTLTRQTIAGFSSIGDPRTLVGENADAANGLTVIEQRGGAIRVRHDISTAPANVNTREWPVIQQTYNMIRNILGLYDQSIVGQYRSNSTGLIAVQNLTSAYLRNLVSRGQLGNYSNLNVAFNPSDPTAVNVSWSYQPIYTILYVNITIGLNVTSGASTVTTSSSSNPLTGNTLL